MYTIMTQIYGNSIQLNCSQGISDWPATLLLLKPYDKFQVDDPLRIQNLQK